MRKIFCQPYSKGKHISCYYGKALKGHFKGDIIRVHFGIGDDLFMTPDEASTLIRALSAGLSHYLVNNDKLAKLKEK